ncbi:MAG TPA: hypothetical protein EYP17_01865 [Candidatus Latescibacteria bacterium]|nr:hypothetical protein [Candidatus Latescibacterota bacterium]
MVKFCRENPVRDASGVSHSGLLSLEDLGSYEARVEELLCTSYRGFTVYKCNSWTQGPVLLQTLNLSENFDLASMDHNSADYIHTVTECMKLAYADVVPGLGFPLEARGQMFSLVRGHPNCLEPGKRPRTTLTPSLLSKGGEFFIAFGSPGGDAQDQWALQFLLNVVEFGMSLQEAVEAPTFWTRHFPSSFYPRNAASPRLDPAYAGGW